MVVTWCLVPASSFSGAQGFTLHAGTFHLWGVMMNSCLISSDNTLEKSVATNSILLQEWEDTKSSLLFCAVLMILTALIMYIPCGIQTPKWSWKLFHETDSSFVIFHWSLFLYFWELHFTHVFLFGVLAVVGLPFLALLFVLVHSGCNMWTPFCCILSVDHVCINFDGMIDLCCRYISCTQRPNYCLGLMLRLLF